MTDPTPPPDESRHNQLYREACALIDGLLVLHDREPSELDERGRERLLQADGLFQEVLQIKPDNWPAMWLLGKIHQRLGDSETSLIWFTRAHELNPAQPDVAREASLAAMDLSRADEAIRFCERAIQADPEDSGLRANLALALLLAGRPEDALKEGKEALVRDPADTITTRLVEIIQEVCQGSRPCPRHVRDLE